jgi:hypothetical protein
MAATTARFPPKRPFSFGKHEKPLLPHSSAFPSGTLIQSIVNPFPLDVVRAVVAKYEEAAAI